MLLLWSNHLYKFQTICTLLDQHTELDFYSASSLKQQSVGRHVVPLGHIILIPSQPVFVLSPYCCVHSGEATNTNFIIFGLTRSGLEPTIYHYYYHYTTDAVHPYCESTSIRWPKFRGFNQMHFTMGS